MANIVFFFVAMCLPWFIGYFTAKFFLRKQLQLGCRFFCIGLGYLYGWFFATLILRLYSYFHKPFNIVEIVLIELAVLSVLLIFDAKRAVVLHCCEEKNTSNISRMIIIVLLVLLLYRWGLTFVDLMSKPIFPWDGWWSWSAKAKAFYYSSSITDFSHEATRFWLLKNFDVAFVGNARHPYFVSLIQTYVALSWGEWNDSIVNLPWLGVSIATVCTIFGFLRELRASSVVALMSGYMVVSLPVFDAQVSLGSYADVWVGLSFLIAVLILIILLMQKNWYLLILFFLSVCVTYLSKNTSAGFLFALCVTLCWHFFGHFVTLLLLLFSCVALIYSTVFINDEQFQLIRELLSSGFSRNIISYNPVGKDVVREWFVLDNWHYALTICFSFLFIIRSFSDRGLGQKNKALFGLLLVGLAGLLVMLLMTFMTTKMPEDLFVGYFNRVSLYFMPVLCLIPFCTYLIMNNDSKPVA